MLLQVVATIAILGFLAVLMEEPYKDWRKQEIGLFELVFALAIFAGPTILAIAVIWF